MKAGGVGGGCVVVLVSVAAGRPSRCVSFFSTCELKTECDDNNSGVYCALPLYSYLSSFLIVVTAFWLPRARKPFLFLCVISRSFSLKTQPVRPSLSKPPDNAT